MSARSEEEEKIQVHIPYPMLAERLQEALDLGLNPEVYIDGADLEAMDRGFLRRAGEEFKARGLRITQHGPYINVDPASLQEEARSKAVQKYRKAFTAARLLGARVIVLHACYSDNRFSGDVSRWVESSMKTWPEFVEMAGDIDLTIAAENIFEREPGPLKQLVEEINSPSFRLCIDSGHLNIFSGVSFEAWFKALGPYIAELHLHDNNGEADEHLPLGDGTIDFAEYFRLLRLYKVRPVYTIEPHGEESFRRALRAARSFISPEAG
ncbi:MAG: sugar phosphate isomerase/epimerase family protein [Thermodesulfobacteriota bacterium]